MHKNVLILKSEDVFCLHRIHVIFCAESRYVIILLIQDSLTMDVTGRSAGHDEDFIPSFSMNKQGSPHEQHKVDETSEDKEARLSDVSKSKFQL